MAHAITIRAVDGYPLGATHYPAQGTARGQLVVAGATAVPQGHYRRFAEHAAARGWHVTTFDYRGVGRSAPASLRGFDANFLDWARYDLTAIVAAAAPDLPVFLVGHSWGGHALGLLPNHARIAGAWLFGIGTGWTPGMPPLERLKVRFLWRVAGPLLVRVYGYLAWRRIGMGADLPLGVYRQWKRWCRYPRFFLDDPEMAGAVSSLARVRTPIMAVNATGDRWASPAARNTFMSGFQEAPWQPVDIDDPRRGHMGYFRADAASLWDAALAWFDARRRPGLNTSSSNFNH